jgi:peptide/nickel transport system ATP-binding protein
VSVVLRIEQLRMEVLADGAAIVDGVDLTLHGGEILGLVGESGSGKTTTALALLGYTRPGVRAAGGQVTVAGERISGRGEDAIRALRGKLISYVPQDPGNSLNPALRVADAVRDVLRAHGGRRTPEEVLDGVRLPISPAFTRRFPHQLSGGQQQRVTIAMALACEPPLIVLDEPTTGLDVVTQALVLDEIRRVRDERGVTMLYVSHDLAVIAAVADRIAVMYAGRIVEEGPTDLVLGSPRHPYTRGLVEAIPDHTRPRRLHGMAGAAEAASGWRACAFAPRCPQRVAHCEDHTPELVELPGNGRVRCFEWRSTPPPRESERRVVVTPAASAPPVLEVVGLRAEHGRGSAAVVAAQDVDFQLAAGECVALVGESGSGKTTVARCVAGLHAPAAGSVRLDGVALAPRAKSRTREARRRIQIVFQNPYDSLNPRQRVIDQVARPAMLLRGVSSAQARAAAAAALGRVRLPSALGRRYPSQLSGGERQRVAIARALVAEPDVVVCDEITSALDVSVQAAVLEMLDELRAALGLSLLFITHDLGVVAAVADRVVVLEQGHVREHGPVEDVLARPEHEYTRALLKAAPSLGTQSMTLATEPSR